MILKNVVHYFINILMSLITLCSNDGTTSAQIKEITFLDYRISDCTQTGVAEEIDILIIPTLTPIDL
jgi:hypothetical protein